MTGGIIRAHQWHSAALSGTLFVKSSSMLGAIISFTQRHSVALSGTWFVKSSSMTGFDRNGSRSASVRMSTMITSACNSTACLRTSPVGKRGGRRGEHLHAARRPA